MFTFKSVLLPKTFLIVCISCLTLSNAGFTKEYLNSASNKQIKQTNQLNNSPKRERQVLPAEAKANACQGAFDKDGFPLTSSNGVKHLKESIDKARQRNVEPNYDKEVQAAVRELVRQSKFHYKFEDLGQQIQSLYLLSLSPSDSTKAEAEILRQQARANFLDLMNDPCFVKFTRSLYGIGVPTIPY